MSVGSNIKKRRFELKMSQQDLADAMGYKTRSTIAKIESGENDVSQKKLVKFAQVLDTTVESLISSFSPTVQNADFPVIQSNKRNKNIAVILAGGKSGRNRQNIPSQFIDVNGKPIIVYCMEVYQTHPLIDDIYVVCLKGWENIVKAYAEQYGIRKLKNIIPAGNSGIASLKNALDYINNLYNGDDFVVIQEATRPMVTPEMISRILQSSAESGSATICHSMSDYVQFRVENKKARYVDRDSLIALQSPEAHRLSLMNEVFLKAKKQQHPLTESCCTMLLYNLGYSINFIEGNVNNIKIVREEDIAALSAMIKNNY
ncbi:MAG: XRE family transcriptional regulator [Clostridia bacterium]|nr:XRE family transcriptional regulator [Clostridia bacterium]